MVGSTFQYNENNQRLHHSADLAGEYNPFPVNQMDCSHWPTPTTTLTKWVCNPFGSVLVPVSLSASVNSPAYYN